MGIGSGYLQTLANLKNKGYLENGSRVIEIGAQQLHNSFLREVGKVNDLGALFGVKTPFKRLEPTASSIAHGELEALGSDAPFARDFYTWLGFEYAAVDIDGSPNSLPLDLNYDSAPWDAIGKYNLVTNFGTTEHVANQINAFKLIHELAAPNGIMVHELPAQGYLNHGLVNYNPKFFWMLARSNGYELIHMDFNWSGVDYLLPQNILDYISQFVDTNNRPPYKTADAGILVIIRKVFDTPFVAPLDVPTGTKAPNKALEERYWSVFDQNAFRSRTAQKGGTSRAKAFIMAVINRILTVSK